MVDYENVVVSFAGSIREASTEVAVSFGQFFFCCERKDELIGFVGFFG